MLAALFFAACVVGGWAESPKLVVRPRGTNHLQLTVTALESGVTYIIMARSNSPDAQWRGLTWIIENTNSTATLVHDLGQPEHGNALTGLTVGTIRNWSFAVGSGEDCDGNGLHDLYEELVMRSDPYSGADPYGDPDEDGWVNIQEMQNGTDPFKWDQPPLPQAVNVRRYTNGTVTVDWMHAGGPHVDYFLVERTVRTLLPDPDGTPVLEPGKPVNEQEILEYWARMRRRGRPRARSFSRDQVERWSTNAPQTVARVPVEQGKTWYKYAETNFTDSLTMEPLYRIKAHYTPVFRAALDRVTPGEIRKTQLQVSARPATNGYDLTASRVIPCGRYLLLVRDKRDREWRASGYFVAGTNRNPVHLHVDQKGMMHEGQAPVAMPVAEFLPDVVDPEFVVGWGEDSDGDGLPDIYEVLVTRTEPDCTDSGNTGTLDGFKEPVHDGWTNLEKFRRRVNPQEAHFPPAPVLMQKPTFREILEVLGAASRRLPHQPEFSVRRAGDKEFKPEANDGSLFYLMAAPGRPRNARADFDVRITWHPPRPKPRASGYSGP